MLGLGDQIGASAAGARLVQQGGIRDSRDELGRGLLTGCAQRIGVFAFRPEVTKGLVQIYRRKSEVEAAAGSGDGGLQGGAACPTGNVVKPITLGAGHANAGRIGSVLAAEGRIAGVDCASIAVIAADRGIHATTRWVASVRGAGIVVVARRVRRVDATAGRVASVRGAGIVVVARRVRRVDAASRWVASVRGAGIVVVARRVRRIHATAGRVACVRCAGIAVVADDWGVLACARDAAISRASIAIVAMIGVLAHAANPARFGTQVSVVQALLSSQPWILTVIVALPVTVSFAPDWAMPAYWSTKVTPPAAISAALSVYSNDIKFSVRIPGQVGSAGSESTTVAKFAGATFTGVSGVPKMVSPVTGVTVAVVPDHA